MKFSIAMTIVLGVTAGPAHMAAPNGYRFPTDADYSDGWKDFRASTPTPFVVKADFDNDGQPDQAWLLPAIPGPGWAVFVFLGSSKGPHRTIRLERDQKTEPQGFGMALVKPGQYKTACGKGYFECKRGEPDVLDLTLPAFELFKYESASSIFWWDSKSGRFKRTWISD